MSRIDNEFNLRMLICRIASKYADRVIKMLSHYFPGNTNAGKTS